ncbi:MAG: SpoIIE family protein phosphatase [Myxococcaceae bacterium]|nr:SpoIIE family protein phosphatase [Myxococcaceae bacterium]
MKELDKLLVRQLKRLGLDALDRAPSLEEWTQFVERISDQYRATSDDRALLTRSLDLSTEEMNQLRHRVESERDRLQSILAAIAEAISVMGQAESNQPERAASGEASGIITSAKNLFAERLKNIFSEGTAYSPEESSRVRVIETGFFRLADQVESMMREMSTAATLRKEVEVARAVQQMLLPTEDTFVRPGFSLAAWCQPAQECGGDWWAVREQADGKLLVVVGDVTGHGIASAILTGTARAACDLAHLMTRAKVSPQIVLHLMNHAVHQAGGQKVLMTAVAALIDPVAKTLTLANAGHVFPMLMRDGAPRPMVAHGPPLGSNASHEFAVETIKLEPGDALVWFTDGLTERANETGEQFSEKRLRASCMRGSHLAANELRDDIVRSVHTFAGNTQADDDVTLVVARIG